MSHRIVGKWAAGTVRRREPRQPRPLEKDAKELCRLSSIHLLLLLFRPCDLLSGFHGGKALIHELLNAGASIGLCHIEISLRIGSQIMRTEELARGTPAITK